MSCRILDLQIIAGGNNSFPAEVVPVALPSNRHPVCSNTGDTLNRLKQRKSMELVHGADKLEMYICENELNKIDEYIMILLDTLVFLPIS